jgi:hypothetical protein
VRTDLAKFDADEVLKSIQALDREPFKKVLADLLECMPDNESIKAFAKRFPDRYLSCLKSAAQLGGYQNEPDTQNNYFIQINNISDAEVLERRKEVQRQLEALDD